MDGFLNGDQSLQELLAAYNVDLNDLPADLINDLGRRDGSYEFIRAWCRAGRLFGHSQKLTPILCELISRDDHEGHEELADALQDLRDPQSVECLFERANQRLAYLEYDDSGALARRCVWALHDVGNAEAITKLNLLTSDSREEVSGEAVNRLEALRSRSSGDGKPQYRIARDNQLGSL
jgi:hypothetical protein